MSEVPCRLLVGWIVFTTPPPQFSFIGPFLTDVPVSLPTAIRMLPSLTLVLLLALMSLLLWLAFLFLPSTSSSPLGLHRLQGRPCYLPSAHSWTLSEETFPQGILPHPGASGVLLDEEGPEQRKEAHGLPHSATHP